MLLKNAEVMDESFALGKADILLEGDRISAVGPNLPLTEEALDLTGYTIFPGFVDIHIHGCGGFDTCDASREALAGIASQLAQEGITSFCPTTMTISREGIEKTLGTIRACMEQPPEGAAILGVNMEGPYIALGKKGGQKAESVRKPDWQEFKHFYELSGGAIRIVDIAPECEGADELIRHAKELCTVSIAHTESGYEEASAAFQKGVSHVTHLFNAMPGLGHREPGVVGAVLDNDRVTAELICDGFHVHPAVLRMAFRLLGEDRSVVVSDSMRAAGLSDGTYDLGGQPVIVRDGKARLADGTIAGSTTNLYQEVCNLIQFGIPLRQAVKAATINPARVVGADREIGSIEAGKRADLLILDAQRSLKAVILRGKFVKNLL